VHCSLRYASLWLSEGSSETGCSLPSFSGRLSKSKSSQNQNNFVHLKKKFQLGSMQDRKTSLPPCVSVRGADNHSPTRQMRVEFRLGD
jgi:hypothetical protein